MSNGCKWIPTSILSVSIRSSNPSSNNSKVRINSMDTDQITQLIDKICREARQASLQLAAASMEEKNSFLQLLAQELDNARPTLIEENQKDLEAGRAMDLTPALLDRLELTEKRIQQMIEGVLQVAALEDPVGEDIGKIKRPNGLLIRKVRVPLGVVGIIYESRPNVTIDCAALCLKSGNAAILRGGKEAIHTNRALAEVLTKTLARTNLPPYALQLIPTTDRYALSCLLKKDDSVQCLIPRGGESLIRFVVENSTIPVIKHYKGVCHLYLDEKADPEMARRIAINAKCQRPGVCNAIEKLLLHDQLPEDFIGQILTDLHEQGVALRLDPETAKKASAQGFTDFAPAQESDWDEEYLDMILAVKTIASTKAAVAHINQYGSGHSEAIVTADATTARTFQTQVDAAAVYWNASTRFTDGYEFGLGAEIGISTDKLHARGPMGLRELCSYKYLVDGTGTIKE
ncbi:MAG: glutamate-5-semialdehyde dehydrogenase [Opitutales bacterium]|nr:glutamate-5-semialdehyde dehydrogenase [Opitutales bacterium]